MLDSFLTHTSKTKLNWLRAAVLGANDGIVSIAGLVVGVAGATQNSTILLTVGIAGLVAGALSMAAGEYVSVSTQRDAEKSYIDKEKLELKKDPDGELQELVEAYEQKGLSKATATKVAKELTEHDALAAHLDTEFGLNEEDLTNPWHAALASAVSFSLGGLIPVLAILLPPVSARVIVTFISVVIALALTGYISAKMSGANEYAYKATFRVIIWGSLAMAITYVVGVYFGA
jgi:VIT1/CCC1 family predicted Fe2+/Mn2+ transporter